MIYLEEPRREIPVVRDTDVIVLGGGIAGAAAALAAVREGAGVILIEKESALGGLATLGKILIYLPLCDGMGRQVMGGLAEELLHLSMEDTIPGSQSLGFKAIPACWLKEGTIDERRNQRFKGSFNPASFQIGLENLLQKEGVEIWYDTRFSRSQRSGGELSHIIVENKSGRMALTSKSFVDASGDGDLCFSAGEGTAEWNHNVLSLWHYILEEGLPKLQSFSKKYKFTEDGACCEKPHFSGCRGKDVTRQIFESRRLIKQNLDERRKMKPGESVQLFSLPSIPSFRATRRLNNKFMLKESHKHGYFDDTIGLTCDWRRSGPVYPLPLRALQGDVNRNLFSAGRCISAHTDVWDVTRVIPACAVTGEAAGTAAAQKARHYNGQGNELDIDRLRESLISRGVLLDRELCVL